jgi:teichuronic acid biosynthesis glycosyltransferase TuaC
MTSVLNLVTNDKAPFYRQQVAAVGRVGVTCSEVAVPGQYRPDLGQSRTVVDYLRFYPSVLRRSFGPFDLIHANQGLTAPAALAQPNLPVVVSLWGLELRNQFGPITRRCARRCDAVIVMSEEMARQLDRECHVIPHGIDLTLFSPDSQARAQATLGWDPDRRHILFPYATVRDEKDFPRTRRVVDAARDRLATPVELHTPFPVPHGAMPVYLNAADALLVTSKSEGSPNAVKEALACNLPVVSTDVGDVRERLDGVSRSSVCHTDAELVEALVAVLEAGQRSDGRAHVRDLSLERMTDRLLSVYEEVLAG